MKTRLNERVRSVDVTSGVRSWTRFAGDDAVIPVTLRGTFADFISDLGRTERDGAEAPRWSPAEFRSGGRRCLADTETMDHVVIDVCGSAEAVREAVGRVTREHAHLAYPCPMPDGVGHCTRVVFPLRYPVRTWDRWYFLHAALQRYVAGPGVLGRMVEPDDALTAPTIHLRSGTYDVRQVSLDPGHVIEEWGNERDEDHLHHYGPRIAMIVDEVEGSIAYEQGPLAGHAALAAGARRLAPYVQQRRLHASAAHGFLDNCSKDVALAFGLGAIEQTIREGMSAGAWDPVEDGPLGV